MAKRASTPSEPEIEEYRKRIRGLSNSGRYKEAYALAARLHKQFPTVLMFAYWESVYTAEDTRGLSSKETDRLYRLATKKLRPLLRRLRGVEPNFARGIRNEYYWFSRQPLKQYKLGVSSVKAGIKRAYYSQGVGASQLAYNYAMNGRPGMALRWAKISEKAWLNYFKIVPDWYNSYLFYARALGIQGRHDEMMKALKKGSKISGLGMNDFYFVEIQEEVARARQKITEKMRK